MNKIFLKLLSLFLLLLLTNCGAPGVAFLSPAITGATTKSAHQATFSMVSSFSSNQLINKQRNKMKDKFLEKKEKIFDYLNNIHPKKI